MESTKVTVSLQALYERFGEEVEDGTIVKSEDENGTYYELYNHYGMACMDGETCKIMDEGSDGIFLKNMDGEIGTFFTLSREEFDIGCFK